jgi:hypothetical protein
MCPPKYLSNCARPLLETCRVWRFLSHVILQSPDFLTRRARALALVFEFVLCGFVPLPLEAQNITIAPRISTAAGTGTAGYNGDNIAATSAELGFPEMVTLDARATCISRTPSTTTEL